MAGSVTNETQPEMPAGQESLDLDGLMKDASAAAGLDDYGTDQRFVEPIQRFLQSVHTEAQLHPPGLASVPADVSRWLMNRLRMQADLTQHPEIREEDVSDPIFIVGLPRTGTTKLQRLLGRDPAAQSLPFWKILNPAPFPSTETAAEDPRLAIARGYVEVLQANFPELMDLHPFVAEEPEEEVVMLEMTGRSPSLALFYNIPTFWEWLRAEPQVPLYDELRTILQYQQWLDGGRRDRPWVLKSPMHLGRIDALFEVFPNASVVHCHRELFPVMTSICNLVEAARRLRSDAVDTKELGAFLTQFLSSEWRANLEQRDRLNRDGQIFDVAYEQIKDDAQSVIRDLYQARGQKLSEEAERSMAEWAQSNHGRGPGYPRPAADYGLTEESIAQAFSPYREHFPQFSGKPA